MIRGFLSVAKLITCWSNFSFKRDHNLMNKQDQYQTDVRVSFAVDMCWILECIVSNFRLICGAHMAQVLDFWGVDCPFWGYLGILNPVKCGLLRRHVPCLVFLKYQLSKGNTGQVPRCVLTVFYQCKLTFVNTNDYIQLWKPCFPLNNSLTQEEQHEHQHGQEHGNATQRVYNLRTELTGQFVILRNNFL